MLVTDNDASPLSMCGHEALCMPASGSLCEFATAGPSTAMSANGSTEFPVRQHSLRKSAANHRSRSRDSRQANRAPATDGRLDGATPAVIDDRALLRANFRRGPVGEINSRTTSAARPRCQRTRRSNRPMSPQQSVR